MDGFEDDFSPLQGSEAKNNSSMDPPLCPTGAASISPSLLDDNIADIKDGDDVPALRCKIENMDNILMFNRLLHSFI